MTKMISPATLDLICKIRRRVLDPRNHHGDREAALAALDRLMATHGIDQYDIDAALNQALASSSPQPQESPRQPQPPYSGDRPWQQVAETCLASGARFRDKDRGFLEDMACQYKQPSRKQLDWLASLHKKISRQWSDVR